MATVVQAKCPGCRQTLTIPSDWVAQAVRCKHCGLVLKAKQASRPGGVRPAASSRMPPPTARKIKEPSAKVARAAPPPLAITAAPPAPATAYPMATPAAAAYPAAPAAVPLAVATAPVATSASPFDAIDGDVAAPAAVPSRYRRSRGGWWKGPAVALGVLLVAGVVAVLAWPYIRGAFQLPAASVAQVDPGQTDVKSPAVVETPRPKEPPKVKEVRPSEPSGKDKPAGPKDKDKGVIRPKDTEPRPADVPSPRPADTPKGSAPFPRRALVISVQNYLYANPVHAGMPITGARNIPNLLEALNKGLHIPMNEMAQLSDGAPKGARPPMKDVIEKTLTSFLESSRPQDRIMVFFIGHGVAIGDEMYLAPIEGELDNAATLIPLKWVYEQMAKCKARQKVLVIDVNRLNPGHGVERPNGGAMDPKEDAALKAPPDGVQVWTACVADQQSYELDDAPMGAFLDNLYTALAPAKGEKGLEGKIQRPDDPLPVEQLAALVNASLKEELAPYKLEQQSRLAGAEPKEGAPFNKDEPPAPDAALALAPAPMGGSPKEIQAVLDEVGTPSIKASREDSGIHFEVLPPFPPEKLAEYKNEGEPTDDQKKLRDAVEKARALMWALNTTNPPMMLKDEVDKERKTLNVSLAVMKDGYRKPADDTKFKAGILNDEKDVATMMQACDDALAALKDAGAARDKETKRWQANYDFTLARLEAQYAYLYEYQSMLGQMRKQAPDLAPGQNGWKLASVATLKGDSQGKKLAKDSNKLLEKIIKDDPGTPWEVLAKREKLTALGLEWQGAKNE